MATVGIKGLIGGFHQRYTVCGVLCPSQTSALLINSGKESQLWRVVLSSQIYIV